MPPIPDRVVSTDGMVVIASGEIERGQAVWQTMGGMSVGSIWGHGAYVAPDWTADWLHRECTSLLDAWALRGVLLLNPVLTVEVGATGSHMDCGWQALTVEIVQVLSRRVPPPAFLLWGTRAQAFWASADPGPAPAFLTRHPSYDFNRTFMSEGSHFEATSDLVDWWAIGRKAGPVL